MAAQPSSACRTKSADGEGGDSTGVARAVAAATGKATKTNFKVRNFINFYETKIYQFFVSKKKFTFYFFH